MRWIQLSFRCCSASSHCKTRRLNKFFSITPWTTCLWLKELKTPWATCSAIKYPALALFLMKASSLETTSLISFIRVKRSQRVEASQFSSRASPIWHALQSSYSASLWRTTLRTILWIQSWLVTSGSKKCLGISLTFSVSTRKIWTFSHRMTCCQNFRIIQRSMTVSQATEATYISSKILR